MNRIFDHLGNTLIILSIISFAYTFYPIIQIYLFPPKPTPVIAKTQKIPKGTYLNIPKINAQAPIIENVNPWNQTEYNQALKKGVAHAKGTYLPGQKGTTFLFAHSSGPSWEITRYNTIFFRLNELQINDKIEITKNGKKYTYKVYDKKEVWPTETNYLEDTKKDRLILQTCTPIGTDLKRLLIFAKPS
jgi:LPXTG-site transpeptidase (sortase) family protein